MPCGWSGVDLLARRHHHIVRDWERLLDSVQLADISEFRTKYLVLSRYLVGQQRTLHPGVVVSELHSYSGRAGTDGDRSYNSCDFPSCFRPVSKVRIPRKG